MKSRWTLAVCLRATHRQAGGLGALVLAAMAAMAVEPLALVCTNGDLRLPAFDKNRALLLEFGMPAQAPDYQRLEEEGPPLFHTRWDKDGIRYTQTLLLTRLGKGGPATASGPASNAVLLVRLAGENLASDYTNASARLAARFSGASAPLTFSEGVVAAGAAAARRPLLILDLPAGAALATNNAALQVEGSMPPGTSGAMVVKLPLFGPLTPAIIEQLKFMEYDEELARLRKERTQRDTNQPPWMPFRPAAP